MAQECARPMRAADAGSIINIASIGGHRVTPGRPDRPTKTGRIPLGRRGTLDNYVGAILFLISGVPAYVTGTDLLVDGGAAILR